VRDAERRADVGRRPPRLAAIMRDGDLLVAIAVVVRSPEDAVMVSGAPVAFEVSPADGVV